MLAARVSCDPGAVPPHDPATVTGQHMVFSYEPTSLLLDTGAKHKTLVFIMTQLGPLAATCDPAPPPPRNCSVKKCHFVSVDDVDSPALGFEVLIYVPEFRIQLRLVLYFRTDGRFCRTAS